MFQKVHEKVSFAVSWICDGLEGFIFVISQETKVASLQVHSEPSTLSLQIDTTCDFHRGEKVNTEWGPFPVQGFISVKDDNEFQTLGRLSFEEDDTHL